MTNLNLSSREENKRAAIKSANSLYLYYKYTKKYTEKESKEKTINALMEGFLVSEEVAIKALDQMWN